MKPKPDSAQWWQEVAAGLGVEIGRLREENARLQHEIDVLTLLDAAPAPALHGEKDTSGPSVESWPKPQQHGRCDKIIG